MSAVSDLSTWRLFFKVVAKGSISKVAEELQIEASSVSRRINKLERELGVELFRKEGKHLALTAAGTLAYSRMRRVTLDAITLIKDLQEVNIEGQETITIAAPIGLSESVLAPAFAQYQTGEPDVAFSLRSLGYTELVNAEALSSYDIVLSTVPLNVPTRDSKLICGIENFIGASLEYIHSLKYPIRYPRDLSEHPVFSFFSQNRERNILLRKGKDTFPLHTHARIRLNHPGAVKALVIGGCGVGVYCPKHLYAQELKNGTVLELLPEWDFPVQPLFLTRRGESRPAIERFIQWFTQYIDQVPGLVPLSYDGIWSRDFAEQVIL